MKTTSRKQGRAVTVRLSDVEAKPARWLWPGYLPLGKLTLLDGDPDKGKSMLALDIAARVTTGRGFSDGAGCETGGVVILSAEDDLEDTIRPRLDAAGANSSRVISLAGVRVSTGQTISASLSDLGALEEAVRLVGAKLVIVDTLTDFFGSGSLLNPQAVRCVLLPLIGLARKLDFAVVAIRHFTKTGTTLISKGAGSTAIAAVARSGLFVVKDPDDDSRRILASFKHNTYPTEPPALAFRFLTERGSGRVSWEGPTDWTAESLFAASLECDKSRTARREARDFLQKALDLGPMASTEVIEAGKAHGIAPRTLERARRDLGVTSERRGGRKGTWYLRLLGPANEPEKEPPSVTYETTPVIDASNTAEGRNVAGFSEVKDRHSDSGGLYGHDLPPELPNQSPNA